MRITMYLLREDAPLGDSALRDDHGYQAVATKPLTGLTCQLYVRSRPPTPSRWVGELAKLAANPSDLGALKSASSGAVLLAQYSGRIFVIAFGSGYHAIEPGKIERGFGLRVTANAILGSKIKSADTRRLNRDGPSAKVIAPVAGTLQDLGVEPNDEWVRHLSGTARATTFATSAAGADSLRLSVKDFSLIGLADKLQEVLKYSKATDYQAELSFIDNFVGLNATDPIVAALDKEVTARVLAADPDIYFAAPDPFEQLPVESYVVHYRKKIPVEELTQADIYGALAQLKLKDDPLRQVRIEAVGVDGESVDKLYPLYNYIQAEIAGSDGNRHILSAGQWFRVADSYVAEVAAYLTKIDNVTGQLQLPPWTQDAAGKYLEEGQYNVGVAAARGYQLLDKDNLHFGNHRRIEVCDLLTPAQHLLCVKRATRSSSLSHLFAQGSVSAGLMHEPEYQTKLLAASAAAGGPATWGAIEDWTIVFAIGTSKPGPLAESLFFWLSGCFRGRDHAA